jgi:hypothetical protein
MRKLAIHEIDGKVQFHSVLEVRAHPGPVRHSTLRRTPPA